MLVELTSHLQILRRRCCLSSFTFNPVAVWIMSTDSRHYFDNHHHHQQCSGGKYESPGPRVTTTVCLSSLWPQDQGQLVQAGRPLSGEKSKVILQPCFFIIYHNAYFKVHPIPDGAEVSCPEENGGCGQPFPDLVWP